MNSNKRKTIAFAAAAIIATAIAAIPEAATDPVAVDWRKFPLWGSTWIVADGINPRIYPSVFPFTPKTVMKLKFNATATDTSVDIYWAKLNWRDFGGTAETVDYVLQYLNNDAGNVNHIHVTQENFGEENNPDSSIAIKGKNAGNDTIGWQLHAYPRVYFYPRGKNDGIPIMTTAPVSFSEAQNRKKDSFDAGSDDTYDDGSLKVNWRNPYFRDSSSVVISFGFNWKTGDSLKNTQRIILQPHTPLKMFRIDGNMDDSLKLNVSQALCMLYTRDDKTEKLARTIDTRCPGWKTKDSTNQTKIFTGSNTNYTRQWHQNDGIFMYNNCPCTNDIPFGYELKTKVEMRQYIYKPIPTCSYVDMKNAWRFYSNLRYQLDDPIDTAMISKKITLLQEAISYRDAIYRHSGVNRQTLITREMICPETWISKSNGR